MSLTFIRRLDDRTCTEVHVRDDVGVLFKIRIIENPQALVWRTMSWLHAVYVHRGDEPAEDCLLPEWDALRPIGLGEIALMAVEVYQSRNGPSVLESVAPPADRFERLESLEVAS